MVALHALDDARRPGGTWSTSWWPTTWSPTSTRCSTACGCSCPMVRCSWPDRLWPPISPATTPARLGWAWAIPDPAVDRLQEEVAALVEARIGQGTGGDLRPGRGAGPLVRARRPGAPGPGVGFDRSRGRAGPAHRAVVLLFRTDRGSARPAGPVRLRPAAPSLPRRAAHSMVEPLRIAGVLVTEVVKRSPDGTGR